MKTKEEFLKECLSIKDEVLKYDDGCFHLFCKCGEGFYMFEGTFEALYKKYIKGCPFCKGIDLKLEVGHCEL